MLAKQLVSSILLLAVCGCGPASGPTANYARSVHGTQGGYSLTNAKPTPPNLMVARKIERPLYIVLDSNRVKDTWAMETSACATHSSGCVLFGKTFETFQRKPDFPVATEKANCAQSWPRDVSQVGIYPTTVRLVCLVETGQRQERRKLGEKLVASLSNNQ